MSYVDGLVLIPANDSFLVENVQRICICDTGISFSFQISIRFPANFYKRNAEMQKCY